jgi:polygalacturonase
VLDPSDNQISRRRALQLASAGAIGTLVTSCSSEKTTISPMVRLRANLDVRSFGATGNGSTSDTTAIQSAVDEASRQGAVLNFPRGRYLSGTVNLRSHVSIHIANGAALVASPDDSQFSPLVPDYGDTVDQVETANASFALLGGADLSNLTIAGPGTIDMNRAARYGEGSYGPKGIGLRECSHVTIDSLTMRNAPNRNIELMGCEQVTITGVRIVNGSVDGIDPDGCKDVRISGCSVDTYDDAIVIKSSLALGRRVDSSNITVEHCHVQSSTNGLKIGTETEGNVTGVRFANCVVTNRPSPGIPLILAEHGGVAIESADGGHVSDVRVSNVAIHGVAGPLFVRLQNRGTGEAVPTPGSVSDVVISDVRATDASITSSITGLPGYPVRNVTLSNVALSYSGAVRVAPGLSVPELPAFYPNVAMFGTLPAGGLYVRHVQDLTLARVSLRQPPKDPRAGLIIDDGQSVRLDDLEMSGPHDPVLWMNNVHASDVNFSRQSALTRSNVRLTGGSDGIVFRGM